MKTELSRTEISMNFTTQVAPAPAHRQIIQLEHACYPYAECGDLMELYPGDQFQGDGIYALQYVRPTGTWHGLRRIRRCGDGLEIEDPRGWAKVDDAGRAIMHLIGRVEKVYLTTPESIIH